MSDYKHTGACGPTKVNSKGGSRYFVTFVYYYYLVKNKMGRNLKTIRLDNGTKYVEEDFNNLCG